MLCIRILAPRASGIVVTAILCCGVPAGAAGCSTAVLTGGRIAPRPIAHAVRSVVIIRCTAITTSACAPVLAGRILLPASITVTMAAGIDRLRFCLTTSTAIRPIAVAGAGRGLLILKNPCMAAAFRAGARPISTGSVTFGGVCS